MTRIAIGFLCGILVALVVGAVAIRCTRQTTDGEDVHAQKVPDAHTKMAEATPVPAPAGGDKPDATKPDANATTSDETAQDAVAIDEDGILHSVFASKELRAQTDEARERIEKAFAEFDRTSGGESAEARLVRVLSSLNPTMLLSAVRDMMRTGDARTRTIALTAIAAIYGDPNSQPSVEMDGIEVSGEADDNEPSPKAGTEAEELDAEIRAKGKALEQEDGGNGDESALRVKLLVESVAAGLADSDNGVKDAAFETMLSLPEEASGILASQILCGDDAALKQQLLATAADSADPYHLQINLQAMSGEDVAARQQAADNLENALGQRFNSAEEAAKWIEANRTKPE